MNSFPHFGQAQNFSPSPQFSYYPVQVVAPSGNNSTTLFSPASQQVFSSVVPSSAVAGGYNNFAPLIGSVGVSTASISPQASTPSAPVSTSFSPQSSVAFVPSSSTSMSVIPGETTWVNTNIPLVTRNTSNMDNLVSDMFRVSNNQLSSQQRNDLIEAINSTENGSGRCVFDGDSSTQVNAPDSNRAAVCVQSDAELIGGLSSGDHEREVGLDVLLEFEDAIVPVVTCELNSGVDQREFHEHGDGLNRDCLEQGIGLDVLLESEDAILPVVTCELNSGVDQREFHEHGDGLNYLEQGVGLDVLPVETCELSNEAGQNVCSEESLRLSRVATVSENVSVRDSLARGDTEEPFADDDDVVSADKRTVNNHPMDQVFGERSCKGNVTVYRLSVCRLPMNIARLVMLYCWLVNEGLGVTA
ncbi:hypothetical protein V6N12_038227 [Hibiscus sabdariffa]|uniref:Uncharacterized protein n=1 Tax=Hibiscus sabdariffa TaxID=183260 RepID=A0ABR2BWX7_9ROSI